MVTVKDKSDLDRLVAEDVQESLTLDYKDAAALGKSSQQRNELFKDVSAFANSAGGQIIYGIQEKDRHPVRVQDTDGVDAATVSREWVEQVIDSNIQPRVRGLHIRPIDVAPGRLAYVITVPQAMADAPHQAPDNKYYYRQNFQSVPMEDYQVRDAMRRATTPELFVHLEFPAGAIAPIEYPANAEMSKPITLSVFIGNRSNQPAFHTLVQLGIDTDIAILTHGDFTPDGQRTDEHDVPQNWLRRRLSSPPHMPIFKESELRLNRSSLTLGCSSDLLSHGEHLLWVTISIQTPGFATTERWAIHQRGASLRLCEPGHPMNR
jgi:schlafen family protein